MDDPTRRSTAPEWDPFAAEVLEDQRRVYDELRERCPVAHSDPLGWSVFRHADVLEVVLDHDTYRNRVSQQIAASVGIIASYLAENKAVEALVRADRAAISGAIDEILRIDAPLVANRRVTARPVTLAGAVLPAGARVSVLWASANRDGRAFPDPVEVRLDRDPSSNLLYGAGIHVCPGAPLARLELQCFVSALLDATDQLHLVRDPAPVRASYPAGGYASVWVALDDAS